MGDTSEGYIRDQQQDAPSLWTAVHELNRRYGDMPEAANRDLNGLMTGMVCWFALAFLVLALAFLTGEVTPRATWVLALVIAVSASVQYVYMQRKVRAFFGHYVRSRLKVVFEEARRELPRPYPNANDYKSVDWVRVSRLLDALDAEALAMAGKLMTLKDRHICWWMATVLHTYSTSAAYSFMYSYAGTGGKLGEWYHHRVRTLEEIAAIVPQTKVA